MAEITDFLVDELARGPEAMPAPTARRIGGRQMARIAREFGGGYFYVPKADALERALRDLRLWTDFDGTVTGAQGINALARREGLTAVRVRDILKAQEEIHRAARDRREAG
jgi:Mor family transcriptional regulator